MNRGILSKALRESWGTTLLLGLILLAAETTLSYFLPRYQQQLSQQWPQFPFVQSIIKGLVGADVAGGIGPEIFQAIPWAHPVILALFWALAIMLCTRVPSGEVDRGTIDVLLSLPVSRWTVHLTETVSWLANTLLAVVLAAAGNAIGTTLADAVWQPARVGIVSVNLFCLCFAVGGIAWFMSSLTDRRGRAIAAAFIVVVAAFLLNYVAQLWKPLDRYSVLSLMHYYQPLAPIRDGVWPLRNIAVLSAIGGAFWIAAGVISSRRDLTTT